MGEVGAMIASAVGNRIASKLGELVKDEISLLWGFRDDVVDMEEKMRDLEAVMHDAEDRLRRGERDGEAVGRWLTKFKSIAYDVEDVLDELDANELIKKTQSKLKLFFSRNNQLLQRMTMAHKMKNVREKIEKIEEDGHWTLKLARRGEQVEGNRNNETFASINGEGMTSKMLGRDIEKEKIINLLLKSEANKGIAIIPIVGLGGLGKSTLAESVLADKRVNVFDIQAWVYVSKEFNLYKIGSAIIKRVNSSINVHNCPLQFLQENLKKELASRRYLIVLDDIWEEDGNKLEQLKEMLRYGCKGSWIIVTTRNGSIVETLHTGPLAKDSNFRPVSESDQINLGELSPHLCWEVMKKWHLGPDDDQSRLGEIGRQIAEKCGGLPLVAIAFGQVMSQLRTVQAWEEIRDGLREVHQKNTLECLKLSYYYMKMEFKMCFAYLAAFPKGFVMDSNRLIQQWIALGYIHASNDGERCINYLLRMSFLQVSRSSSVSPGPVHVKAPRELTMHDLVHDLASIITEEEFLVLDANATEPRSWNRARYCRHAQLINYQYQPDVFRELTAKVRSLHFRDSGKLQLPWKAFSRSKYMRVLDLNGRSVRGQSTPSNLDTSGWSVEGQSTPSNIVLPSSIHQSKLLRYLDATGLQITSLPKSFQTLKYMQTLILSRCSLETLPDNICSLHKLCYFDLSCNSGLKKLPMSLGKLSKLSFLNLSECSILRELPESICELTCLQHLDTSKCRAIQRLPDRFGSLPKLIFLNLSGCSKLTKLPDNISLESLEHLNLSSCHELENLPKDFGNLKYLVFLNLSYCYKVAVLPESFCQLRHLKDLDLSDCHDLRELPECFGSLSELESLNLSDCYKVPLLPESFCQLSHLKDLDLTDCHDLRELPECFGNLSELESLNLTSCCKLQLLPESLGKLFKLRRLNLSYCMRLVKLSSSFGDLKLQFLDISCAESLIDLPDSIISMTSLTRLEVITAQPSVLDKAERIKKHLNLPDSTRHYVHQIENRECSSIVELAKLTCRKLVIENLENVKDPEDAERAKLRDKSDLMELGLCWRLQGEGGKSVLERLVPPRTLEEFQINGYMSKDFPNWMSDISSYLPFLTVLGVFDLGKCDTLPPFGRLPNLRSLCMEYIPNIRKISKEFYGDGGICTKLRYLRLESMENLVEWWTTQSGEENEEFLIPNLHGLYIMDCPKLKFLPYPPRSMFWFLDNSDEVLPEGGFGKLSSSTLPFEMVIYNCNFSPDKWDRLQHLSTLEIFRVKSCSSLRALPEAIRCFKALRVLWLLECKGLEILSEWIGQLISLQEFNIMHCPNLTSLPESIRNLTNMKELYILGCPSLVERCKGEDAHKISRIPKVELDGEPWSTSQQAGEREGGGDGCNAET